MNILIWFELCNLSLSKIDIFSCLPFHFLTFLSAFLLFLPISIPAIFSVLRNTWKRNIQIPAIHYFIFFLECCFHYIQTSWFKFTLLHNSEGMGLLLLFWCMCMHMHGVLHVWLCCISVSVNVYACVHMCKDQKLMFICISLVALHLSVSPIQCWGYRCMLPHTALNTEGRDPNQILTLVWQAV